MDTISLEVVLFDRIRVRPVIILLPHRKRGNRDQTNQYIRYAVDALQLSLQGIIAVQAVYEFQPSYTKGLTIAVYVGMLVGALFWGTTADIIGRKVAFNVSLFICSIFTIVAGAAPNWDSLGFFIAMAAFGAGGNLILDTTVFLEYLPSYKQYLVSCLAAWWGIGCTIAGLVAWAFMSECCLAVFCLLQYLPHSPLASST